MMKLENFMFLDTIGLTSNFQFYFEKLLFYNKIFDVNTICETMLYNLSTPALCLLLLEFTVMIGLLSVFSNFYYQPEKNNLSLMTLTSKNDDIYR